MASSDLTYRFNGQVLCMGAINMDLVMRLERWPRPGETLLTDNFETYPGGKGGNQAVAAALLGAQVQMLTMLSDDDFSRRLIGEMAARGVKMDRVMIRPGGHAGVAMIWVDRSGQNTIAFTPGSNAWMTPADVRGNEDLFTPGRILLITMELACETVFEAIRLAHERGMYVMLDPAPAPSQPLPPEIPPLVDIVKPNESEAQALTGMPARSVAEARAVLGQLRAQGFGQPVITLGEQGLVAMAGDEMLELAPLAVRAVDSTAAGDVFAGGLAAALACGQPMQSALRFANAAGALSTTRHGAQSSIPTLEQVRQLLSEL